MEKRLILTSRGLNTGMGTDLIGRELLKYGDLSSKKIYLFCDPHVSIESIVIESCISIGFKEENIFLSTSCENDAILDMDYIYITEGNTFSILSILKERGIDKVIKQAYMNGTTVIGASAGAMITGKSIEEAYSYDRNEVHLKDYSSLALFDGIVLPHYTKKEMRKYIKNSPGLENRYKMLLSVANDEILVLEMNDD